MIAQCDSIFVDHRWSIFGPAVSKGLNTWFSLINASIFFQLNASVTVILGSTWLLGLTLLADANDFLQFAICALNTSLGVYILMLQVHWRSKDCVESRQLPLEGSYSKSLVHLANSLKCNTSSVSPSSLSANSPIWQPRAMRVVSDQSDTSSQNSHFLPENRSCANHYSSSPVPVSNCPAPTLLLQSAVLLSATNTNKSEEDNIGSDVN